MKHFTQNQLPLFIWAGLIFWLSSIHRIPIIKSPVSLDKVAHIVVYYVFCWFSRRALFFQTRFPLVKKFAILFAFILTSLYGYLDEVHQLYVPGRTYDMYDWLADAIGALLYISVFLIVTRRENTKALALDQKKIRD